ncbi:MAG: ATP-dependent Clp protease proteolytic subunit [Acidimicrobiia bacterium]|nr:ATP-dependent Clp protease proteolytic subunit [Acidimicrobiia bacterium]
MLVPTVIEQTARGERAFDIFSRLLGHRVVFLGRAIDADVANVVIAQLIHLDGEDGDEPIHLYINCPGGEVSSSLAVYDAMQHVSAPVATWCVGMAASAAAIILAGGRAGRRSILPHGRVMIHQPHVMGGIQGQASDIEIQAREIGRQKQALIDILARHTGRDAPTIRHETERDRWMSAEEAVEYGIVDRLATPEPL